MLTKEMCNTVNVTCENILIIKPLAITNTEPSSAEREYMEYYSKQKEQTLAVKQMDWN